LKGVINRVYEAIDRCKPVTDPASQTAQKIAELEALLHIRIQPSLALLHLHTPNVHSVEILLDEILRKTIAELDGYEQTAKEGKKSKIWTKVPLQSKLSKVRAILSLKESASSNEK
jgi:hypothetical protein